MKAVKPCTMPGCESRAYAWGRCRRHYERQADAQGRQPVRPPKATKYPLSDFGANVMQRREEMKLSHAALAIRAGVGINTLTGMLYRSPRSPALYAMEWVAQALERPLWKMLLPLEDAVDLEIGQ